MRALCGVDVFFFVGFVGVEETGGREREAGVSSRTTKFTIHTCAHTQHPLSGWLPSWTDAATPERVVLSRAATLAQSSLNSLLLWMEHGGEDEEDEEEGWKAAVAPAPLSRLGGRELGVMGGFDVVVK